MARIDLEQIFYERARGLECARRRFAKTGENWVANAGVAIRPRQTSADRGYSIVENWAAAPWPARTNSQLYVLAEQLGCVVLRLGWKERSPYLDAFERHLFARHVLNAAAIKVPAPNLKRGEREVRALITETLSRTAVKVDHGIADWAGAVPPKSRTGSRVLFDQISARVIGPATTVGRRSAD